MTKKAKSNITTISCHVTEAQNPFTWIEKLFGREGGQLILSKETKAFPCAADIHLWIE